MNQTEFENYSHTYLTKRASLVNLQTVGITMLCPTQNKLVLIRLEQVRAEDREIFVLCECGEVHQI